MLKASRTISRNNIKKTGLLPQIRLFSGPREGKSPTLPHACLPTGRRGDDGAVIFTAGG